MRYYRMMKRKNKEFMFKVIVGTVIGVLILVGALIMNYQSNQINQLKTDLYLKEQVQERATDRTISIVNVKTIEEKFNELKSYSILKNSKVTMNHTYFFEEDSFLGLKKKATLRGNANLVYNYDITLSDATIIQDEKGNITVEIGRPVLDVESVHYEKDTLIWEQNDYNILCGEEEGQKVTKFFLESFVDEGIKKIQEMYKDEDMQEQLNRKAILETQDLIRTLNLNDCNVQVKIR